MSLPLELINSAWHSTSVERFHLIIKFGYIHPEPIIDEKDRHGNTFVRSLGGISIFDFVTFDEKKYQSEGRNDLYTFTPCYGKYGSDCIWINLNNIFKSE